MGGKKKENRIKKMEEAINKDINLNEIKLKVPLEMIYLFYTKIYQERLSEQTKIIQLRGKKKEVHLSKLKMLKETEKYLENVIVEIKEILGEE